MYDVSEALRDGVTNEMTCIFPDVLENLQGSDNNFEMVTSSTLKPLKMFYVHNVARVLRGYVFVQESLEGVGDWEGTELCYQNGSRIGEPIKARALGEKVRENLMDSGTTNIPEVELLVNKTKAEIVQIFRAIKQLGEQTKREQGCSLGVFVICIGFLLEENNYYNREQLLDLGVPLSNRSY